MWLIHIYTCDWYIHTHNEYYSAIKKNEIIPFAARWMDLKDYHTKWSKPERERQISCDIAYMRNLKKNRYLQNRSTDTKNKLMVTKGGGGYIRSLEQLCTTTI